MLAQYRVGSDGTLLNTKTGRFLRGYLHQSAVKQYRRVLINLHGRRYRIFLHRIVAIMFCDPPDGMGIETRGTLPDVPEVNHIDGNTLNNSADNLEWATTADNAAHRHYLAACRESGLLPYYY